MQIINPTISEEKKIENIISITNATILSWNVYSSGVTPLGSICWLCETDNNELIILNSYYLLETYEVYFFENCIPFADTKLFSSNRLLNNMILSNIPTYQTGLNFELVEDITLVENKSSHFSLKAIGVSEKEEGNIVLFNIPYHIFVSIKFIDYYLHEFMVCEDNLQTAVLNAYKQKTPVKTIFYVDRLDSIIDVVKQDKKSETVITEFSVIDRKDKKEEKAVLIVPFNIDKESCKKYRYKKNKIDEISNQFESNCDIYLTDLMFPCRFANLEKDFLFIQARSNYGDIKLFVLDSVIQKQLEDKIKNY